MMTDSRSGAHADAPAGKRGGGSREPSRRDGGSNPSPLPAVSRDTARDERETFVRTALNLEGFPYVWNTRGPRTFDCSGFVQWCYRVATGKEISPSSYTQFTLGEHVSRGNISRGDLVFWDTEHNGSAGHVAIAIDSDRVISAMNERTGVVITAIDGNYGGPYLGARRLPFSGEPEPEPDKREFADPVPIPRRWDGRDYIAPVSGDVYVALSRIFVARRETAARVSADPRARKVRRDLAKGEAFLGHYVVRGDDGEAWLVSQFGSRIVAKDCEPSLVSLGAVRRESTSKRSSGDR